MPDVHRGKLLTLSDPGSCPCLAGFKSRRVSFRLFVGHPLGGTRPALEKQHANPGYGVVS